MIYGIRQILKYLAGSDIAARNLAVRPWPRFLIASLLRPEHDFEPRYPRIEAWLRFANCVPQEAA